MNKLNELIISGTVGSLVTLVVLASPLFAENKTATLTSPSHSPVVMGDQHQMMQNMAEMMEKCKTKMASHNNNQPAGTQHNQHHPNNTNPAKK